MKLKATLSLILSKVAGVKVLWKKWDIRSFLLASFVFQLFLILTAPIRKRTSNSLSRATLWLSYLLADWVAAQAIGLIIRATEPGCQSVSDSQGYLFAFWAQFLLIHLGGPDTITALALEDNELWLRTALHLGVQAYGTLGVLFRSTRLSGLWAATVLMFFAGVIKYLERVMSLFHGRLQVDFDEDPDEFAKWLMLRNNDQDEDHQLIMITNVDMVKDGFNLFHCHKRLFADRELSREVRRITPEYFRRRTAKEAYLLLEIQLNFTYEAIYTKMAVIHQTGWKILRHVVLLLQVAGLAIWLVVEKHGYQDYDIRITYALVIGAIAVDVLAFLRIQFSDWNIARLDEKSCWSMYLYNKLLDARTNEWKGSSWSNPEMVDSWSWFRRVFLRRWSESINVLSSDGTQVISNYNRRLTAFAKSFRSHRFKCILKAELVEKRRVSSQMWGFIFQVVRNRNSEEEAKMYKLFSTGEEVGIDCLVDRALPTISMEDYPGLIQMWRLVTLRFTKDEYTHWRLLYTPDSTEDENESPRNQRKVKIANLKSISMTLLSYLQYLLIFEPTMMFGAAGKEKLQTMLDSILGHQNPSINHEDGSAIPEQTTKVDNHEDPGQAGVRDIEDLGKILEDIEYEDEVEDDDEREIVTWELIARVWVKLLCYAAIKCRPNVHAEQLKQGGEFLTFVWLLMVHLGFTP